MCRSHFQHYDMSWSESINQGGMHMLVLQPELTSHGPQSTKQKSKLCKFLDRIPKSHYYRCCGYSSEQGQLVYLPAAQVYKRSPTVERYTSMGFQGEIYFILNKARVGEVTQQLRCK